VPMSCFRFAGLFLAILAFLSTAEGFLSPVSNAIHKTSQETVSRGKVIMMANRYNAKKAKRQRNRENMAKFRGKKGSASKRKLTKMKAAEAEKAREIEFMAKLFSKTEPESSS